MTEPDVGFEPPDPDDEEISLLAAGSVMLRYRRVIVTLGFVGAALGLAMGLTSTRMFLSTAIFIPQGPEGATSGLALAASQFGLRVPSIGNVWRVPVYVELVGSHALLARVARDTVVVSEEGGRRAAVMDLLEVEAPTPARRVDVAVLAFRELVDVNEDKKLGAVRLVVKTRWPSISFALAQRLVDGVNRFNVETRRSQATAERLFVERQAVEAERALREDEDQLQLFLQQNRALAGSPELAFQRDRLQRDVALRQQVYTSLVQSRDEARIREVRDTPVISMIEEPRLPSAGVPRRSVLKAFIGGLTGAVLGTVLVFVLRGLSGAKLASSPEGREFFHLLEEATPQFLRPRKRS